MSQPHPPPRVLNVLLTHEKPQAVAAMLEWWRERAEIRSENLLVAYGGPRAHFDGLDHPQKVFVDDPRLRTHDHTRQRQSYRTIFHEVADWLQVNKQADFSHIFFAEYDLIPLAARLNELQLDAAARECADVLGHRVVRVDGTSHPHYLYHANDPAFHRFWAEWSVRADRRAILSMFGAGSFWTRPAFAAVANVPEPFPIYLELFLPTAAHHLGYRVRPYPEAEARAYIRHLGNLRREMDRARDTGAWTIHPVKSLWSSGG